MESRASKAQSAVEKAWCESRIRQLQAYQAELQNYHLEVPTITFGTSHVIKDKAHDLHIEYHGHAHTGGDVVVFCPQARAVATGDMILGAAIHCGRISQSVAEDDRFRCEAGLRPCNAWSRTCAAQPPANDERTELH
jgi:hypothetical protein